MHNNILRKSLNGLPLLCAAVVLVTGPGCAHKKPQSEENNPNAAIESSDLGTSDTGNAMGLQTVRFDYDSALLSSSAKQVLKEDARILKDNPSVMIQIEGNCDARGGIQYNLALGQKRADAAQHFLIDQGIPQSRLATLSYGKEKPLVSGDSEEAYAKNRRANMAITKK
jgi:peptidoglycan-associated lipoprotein